MWSRGGGGSHGGQRGGVCYPFRSPILSFGCVNAGKRMVKQTVEGVEVSREEDMIETNDKQEKTVVRLHFMQPKS